MTVNGLSFIIIISYKQFVTNKFRANKASLTYGRWCHCTLGLSSILVYPRLLQFALSQSASPLFFHALTHSRLRAHVHRVLHFRVHFISFPHDCPSLVVGFVFRFVIRPHHVACLLFFVLRHLVTVPPPMLLSLSLRVVNNYLIIYFFLLRLFLIYIFHLA